MTSSLSLFASRPPSLALRVLGAYLIGHFLLSSLEVTMMTLVPTGKKRSALASPACERQRFQAESSALPAIHCLLREQWFLGAPGGLEVHADLRPLPAALRISFLSFISPRCSSS